MVHPLLQFFRSTLAKHLLTGSKHHDSHSVSRECNNPAGDNTTDAMDKINRNMLQ
jgi:hypothetical protein